MSSKQYTDEFRQEAVKQVAERRHKVAWAAVKQQYEKKDDEWQRKK